MTISLQMLRSMRDELQKTSGITDRLRGAAQKAARSGGHEMGEGLKESLGAGAASLGRKLTSPKALAALGTGSLATGGLAAYGLHRARKRRKQDMTEAVTQGIREALATHKVGG